MSRLAALLKETYLNPKAAIKSSRHNEQYYLICRPCPGIRILRLTFRAL